MPKRISEILMGEQIIFCNHHVLCYMQRVALKPPIKKVAGIIITYTFSERKSISVIMNDFPRYKQVKLLWWMMGKMQEEIGRGWSVWCSVSRAFAHDTWIRNFTYSITLLFHLQVHCITFSVTSEQKSYSPTSFIFFSSKYIGSKSTACYQPTPADWFLLSSNRSNCP